MDGVDFGGGAHRDELPDGTWSVARLNREIERILAASRNQFPTHVVGDVAEVDVYDFGVFFELRDVDDEPSISCLAWSSSVREFEYDLEAGTTAVVEATVDFYPERGDCQLVVSDYWPLGESARQQELEALRRQLAQEGLFDDERKQQIPPYPGCIGLVTSPSGSAREDVWASIAERSPRTDVNLCGATVQGDDAVPSMIDALQRLDRDPGVETIVLTRGGGSDVDLWCFNAEPLVRCVAACRTPVVVAIGHEDDDTLVEHVADARAMTPTEAGVEATTPVWTVLDGLSTVEQRIDGAYESLVDRTVEEIERRVEGALDSLEHQVAQREAHLRRAGDLERRIGTAYNTLVTTRLDGLETRIDDGIRDLELAAESEAATERVARGRLADLEARIDVAYRTHVTREVAANEQRIEEAYRDVEAQARIEAGTTEARRLRLIVAILLAILLLGTIAVVLLLL